MIEAKAANVLVRASLAASAALGLSGCLAVTPAVLQAASFAADGVSYQATGKTVTDHLVSEVTAQDCAMSRVLDGNDVCQEREVPRYPDGTPIPEAHQTPGAVPASQDAAFQNAALQMDRAVQEDELPDPAEAAAQMDGALPDEVVDGAEGVAVVQGDALPSVKPIVVAQGEPQDGGDDWTESPAPDHQPQLLGNAERAPQAVPVEPVQAMTIEEAEQLPEVLPPPEPLPAPQAALQPADAAAMSDDAFFNVDEDELPPGAFDAFGAEAPDN